MFLSLDFGDIPPVAAQDTVNVLKQGYLEKRRKGGFFGSEWQKRWCVLNNLVFYYFGSDKGLCQPEKLQVLRLSPLRTSVLNGPGR